MGIGIEILGDGINALQNFSALDTLELKGA